MPDTRMSRLTKLLMPNGVVGVSVPNWADKATWEIWRAGAGASKAMADPTSAPIVQAFDITPTEEDPMDAWDAITIKISFNHENRIRAIEGKAAMTAAQFKAAVRAL